MSPHLIEDYLRAQSLEESPAAHGPRVGNPPYVRHHDLSPEIKDKARKIASCLNIKVSGLAGLHALFFMTTALMARRGDHGCFVTSAEWLDVGYGQVVRELLSDRLGLESLHLLDPASTPFEDTMTTTVISCFEVQDSVSDVGVSYISSVKDLHDLNYRDRNIPLSLLSKTSRWSCQCKPVSQKEIRQAVNRHEELIPLGKLVRVSRGVATGANGFFVMTKQEAEWRGLARFARAVISRANEVFTAGDIIHTHP